MLFLIRDIFQNFGQSVLLSQYTRKGVKTRQAITDGSLLSVVNKTFTYILNKRLTEWIEVANK